MKNGHFDFKITRAADDSTKASCKILLKAKQAQNLISNKTSVLHTMIRKLSGNNPYLTLKHLEEVEPHGEQDVVSHEPEGDGRMREDVVEVGDERPVAVVAHHML